MNSKLNENNNGQEDGCQQRSCSASGVDEKEHPLSSIPKGYELACDIPEDRSVWELLWRGTGDRTLLREKNKWMR